MPFGSKCFRLAPGLPRKSDSPSPKSSAEILFHFVGFRPLSITSSSVCPELSDCFSPRRRLTAPMAETVYRRKKISRMEAMAVNATRILRGRRRDSCSSERVYQTNMLQANVILSQTNTAAVSGHPNREQTSTHAASTRKFGKLTDHRRHYCGCYRRWYDTHQR